MNQLTIKIPEKTKLLDQDGAMIAIDLEASQNWEVFPIGFSYPQGSHTLFIISDGKENIIHKLGEDGDPDESVMALFCFIDEKLILQSEGDLSIKSVRFLNPDGSLLPNGAVLAGEGSMSGGIVKSIDCIASRAMLRINTLKPSQLNLDIIPEGDSVSQGAIVLAHKDDGSKAWCDVFFDIHDNGRWVSGDRNKIGFFNYKPGEYYAVCVAVIPEDHNDNLKATLKVTISSVGESKTLRSTRVNFEKAGSVCVRESGSTQDTPGEYEVESLTQTLR